MKIARLAIRFAISRVVNLAYRQIPLGAVGLLILSTCHVCVIGCGGGGAGSAHVATTADLEQDLASAQTAAQYQAVFTSLNQKIAVGSTSGPFGFYSPPSPDLVANYSAAIAGLPTGTQQSIAQIFSLVASPPPVLNFPYAPGFSAPLSEVLSQMNAELLLAPSDPDTPINTLLLLLTYDPTNPNATPSPLTAETELSPAQSAIFGTLLSTYVTSIASYPAAPGSLKPASERGRSIKSPSSLTTTAATAFTTALAVVAVSMATAPKSPAGWITFLVRALAAAILYLLSTQDLQ